MPDINQVRILIMATDGFEQSELMVPQEKLAEAAARRRSKRPADFRHQKSGRFSPAAFAFVEWLP